MTAHTYTHSLTELEAACGVTLDAVARELPRGLFRGETHQYFVVDADLAPALASSVARCAFGGAAVEYVGLTALGRVYETARP